MMIIENELTRRVKENKKNRVLFIWPSFFFCELP